MPESDRNIVVMKGIDKSFPGVHALQNVDFSLAKGEIHALVGENGAGKSTLIKILTGVDRADRGTIELDGRVVVVRSPLQAQELGISTVYQEVNLCPNLTVAENILIGRQPSRFGVSVDWKKLNTQAREYLKHITYFRGSRVYDIARFIGADTTMPADLVQGLWDVLSPQAEEWRKLGVFGPAVKVPDDAPLQNRLLALMGRDPQR